MTLEEIVKELDLSVRAGSRSLDREVTGGYTSDLLSDVMGNARSGAIWITLQIHPNIVAVASLKDLSGIVLVGGREPEADTVQKADREGIPILTSSLSAFEIAGRLFRLGVRDG